MKRLSESLEELAGRIDVLKDSATAAYKADRAKLEQRQKEVDAEFDRAVDGFELDMAAAAAADRAWWDDTKASIARPFKELRARHEQRKSEHEVKRAIRAAEAAEEDAAAATDLAAYMLNVAEYAVVDAALARMSADELAGAPTGATTEGATP